MTSTNTQLVTAQVAAALRSEDMQKQMGSMLPPGVRLDRFTEVTIDAIANFPDVVEADRDSLYRACVAAARRGLLPDKKEGALVIYNTNVGTRERPQWLKQVQFLPMVEGIIKEMAKAGIKAYAVAVYENDAISFWNDDDGQHVKHEPLVFGERGNMVGVFAAAKTEDGRPYVEAMALKDIDQVARRSKQCTVNTQTGAMTYGGTWKSDFDRMAQKSALHRLRKRLPIADEDAAQNLKDMEEESDIELNATQAPPTPASDAAAAAQPSPPPPEQTAQQALPAPQQSKDEIDLKKLRTPRRSRVLEGVKAASQQAPAAQAQHAAPTVPNGGGARDKPTSGNPGSHTGLSTPSSGAAAPPSPPPEPEYSEDDIV